MSAVHPAIFPTIFPTIDAVILSAVYAAIDATIRSAIIKTNDSIIYRIKKIIISYYRQLREARLKSLYSLEERVLEVWFYMNGPYYVIGCTDFYQTVFWP